MLVSIRMLHYITIYNVELNSKTHTSRISRENEIKSVRKGIGRICVSQSIYSN